MGFLSDIKKLFFAQKSVAKSTVDKVKDESAELFDKAKNKGSEFYDKAKETGENLFDKTVEKGAEWKEKADDKLEDLLDAFDAKSDESDSSTTEEESQTDEPNSLTPTDSIARDKTFVERLGKKTMDVAEDVGDKTLDGLESLAEKAKELSEDVGEKVMEAKEKLVDKAKEALEHLDKKLDETMEKAKKLDEELSANDKDNDGFADTPVNLSKGTLEDKDDFFSKAERFAKGEALDGKPEVKISSSETEEGPKYKTYGAEDRDGDGNEMIDDAIIED